MNAHDIDWAQAPEGYDYYIVDTYGEHESRFHYLETGHGPLTNIFGEIYVDENGQNWQGASSRLEIYKRPEQGEKPLRLRCVSSDASDNSFSVGTVYEVVNRHSFDGSHIVVGDDDMHWGITRDTLEFAGDPDVGRFEIVEDRPAGVNTDQRPTHLRCLSANGDHYTKGEVYKVLKRRGDAGSYVVETDKATALIVDRDSLAVVGCPDWGTFEIVSEELEDSSKITHLRCIDTNEDGSFTLGSVYEIVEDNYSSEDPHYIVRGDDNMSWAITKDTLEFAEVPEIGKFEAAYVGDSVQASDPTPKTQPEFGDIVHVQGKPYVFIRVDEDGDYYVVSGDGHECYLDLDDMDEYTTPTIQRLRGEILRDLCHSTQRRLEDHTAYDVSFTVPDFIDFIIEHKDNWEL